MKQYQSNFKRYEQKYLMNESQYASLRERLAEHMQEDSYGLHTICNIYYDTDSYELIRTSIEKPKYKEKLRLRSYGIPTADSLVFVELKKKYRGIVYKRRVSMKLKEATAYLQEHRPPQSQDQILREIDWFINLYQPTAKVFLAYDRVALFGNEQQDLRITFDRNIHWRTSSLDLSLPDWGTPVLVGDPALMEIKLPDALPLWLSHILTELEIYPTSFSKYGVCYQKFISTGVPAAKSAIWLPQKQAGGIYCV